MLNYRSLIAEADRTLEVLTANNGAFPGQMFRGSDRPDTGLPPAREEMPGEGGTGALFGTRRGGDRELAYQSRYYSVWFAPEGTVSRIDLEHLVSLTEEEALAQAESVFASGKEKGFAGEYRYCRATGEEETLLVFLNCEREFSTFRDFLYASLGISLAGTVAVFLLLLAVSGRIVRPVAESYAK